MVTAWHQMIIMTGSSPMLSQGTIIYRKFLLKHQKIIVVLVWSQDVRSMMVPLMIISVFKDPSSTTQKSNNNDKSQQVVLHWRIKSQWQYDYLRIRDNASHWQISLCVLTMALLEISFTTQSIRFYWQVNKNPVSTPHMGSKEAITNFWQIKRGSFWLKIHVLHCPSCHVHLCMDCFLCSSTLKIWLPYSLTFGKI